MESTNVKPQTPEEQKDNYRDFISFMDVDINALQRRMEFLRHMTFSTILGCILSALMGFGIIISSVFLLVSITSYITFKYTGKKRNMFIVVRESTYAEMLEL